MGIWLERRATHLEQDAQGRSWMVIDYQIINAAQSLTQAALPAFELKAADGTRLGVAAWPISVGPLTPRTSFRNGDLQMLRPDRIVMPSNGAALQRRMITMLALTFITMLSWAAWWTWRKRRDASILPFARAWRTLSTLDTPELDQNDDAWVHMHRALDETAGQVVHAASLHALFERAPYLEAMKARIEAFYASSQQRFFKRDATQTSFSLRDFARALYRAERRQ
ncbi:putative uncharacterized protein [Caballeronia insecticola]|uniref:MxaA protein n=1 Tax=Caballeronia insecticola TaxID=758793 RepID=R4WP32_9BURK|nr:putative uncharacterized protein [Caballeronia insecticola]